MSYLVFARKYRPQTFDEVVAQEHVTRTLRNAIAHDRVGSSYLFCGPRGTGKTTVARILAKAVNCAEGPTPTPCGKCNSCKEIAAGSALDVLEIDAASNTGVDDIRTLRENVRYLPTSGRKRVYIIDEVHRLSGSAFDALLKTLEEPPDHVMFLFATTEPLKVPETILSRTQRFDFRRVTVDELANHLGKIIVKEELDFEPAAIRLIARKADGSVRDSLSLLDQIAAFAGKKIEEKDVVEGLGLVDRQFLFAYIEAIAAGKSKHVLELTAQLFDAGVDAGDFITELMEHLRVLMILTTDASISDRLGYTPEELEQYRQQVNYFTVGDVLRLTKILAEVNQNRRSGIDDRLLVETAGVRMAELESTVRLEDVLSHLSAGGGAAPGQEAKSPSGELGLFQGAEKKNDPPRRLSLVGNSEDRDSAAQFQTRALNLPRIQAEWDRFLLYLRKTSPMLSSQLRMAKVTSVKDNRVELQFGPSEENSAQVVNTPDNLHLITLAMREHYKANLQVTVGMAEAPAAADEPSVEVPSSRVDPETLLAKSPRLRKLVDKVEGEIIGIKKIDS